LVVDVAQQVKRTPAQVALNWVVQQPGITSTIIGARTLNQLEDNLQCLNFTLPTEQVETLTKGSQPSEVFPHMFLNRFKKEFGFLATGGANVIPRDNSF